MWGKSHPAEKWVISLIGAIYAGAVVANLRLNEMHEWLEFMIMCLVVSPVAFIGTRWGLWRHRNDSYMTRERRRFFSVVWTSICILIGLWLFLGVFFNPNLYVINLFSLAMPAAIVVAVLRGWPGHEEPSETGSR